jgi:hypothetical protein
MTSPTTQDLIECITRITDALMHSEWKASIPFLCVPFMSHMAGIPLPVPAVHDICAYLGVVSSNPLVTRLYLNPPVYNSPPH